MWLSSFLHSTFPYTASFSSCCITIDRMYITSCTTFLWRDLRVIISIALFCVVHMVVLSCFDSCIPHKLQQAYIPYGYRSRWSSCTQASKQASIILDRFALTLTQIRHCVLIPYVHRYRYSPPSYLLSSHITYLCSTHASNRAFHSAAPLGTIPSAHSLIPLSLPLHHLSRGSSLVG